MVIEFIIEEKFFDCCLGY